MASMSTYTAPPSVTSLQADAQRPPNSPHDQDSFVAGHVILWVLISLATNSMSQFAGRPCGAFSRGRYALYLYISPIICFADALSIPLSMIAIRGKLDNSLVTMLRYVVFWRNRPQTENGEQDHVAEFTSSSSWPRWLFFIFNVAPAMIKLLSFSGTPWSRTWGLMFVSSYIFIEMANLVALVTSDKAPTSAPVALGLSPTRWDADVNTYSRNKVEDAESALETVRSLLLAIAISSQLMLSLWVVRDIGQLIVDRNIHLPRLLHHAFHWIAIALSLWVIVGILLRNAISIAIALLGLNLSNPLDRKYLRAENIFLRLAVGIVPAIGYYKGEGSSDERVPERMVFAATSLFGCMIACMLNNLLLRICSKRSRLGKILLVVMPRSTIEGDICEDSEMQEQDHMEMGTQSLTWFLFHCALGVIWYTTRYNPTSTFNPGWSGLFG